MEEGGAELLRQKSPGNIPEEVLECVFGFIDDAADRSAISLVCKAWYSADQRTRRDVYIACCYTIHPARVTRRFKALECVGLKGKPRAAIFVRPSTLRPLIPEDWGGYAEPWISEMALNWPCLKAIHLHRMIVTDKDLLLLAKTCGHILHILELDKCLGFSTIGLEAIAKSCRSLRSLVLDESLIEDHGGEWLHELALHHTSLEVLNFLGTGVKSIDIEDLLTLAMNCKSLSSLKLNELEVGSLKTMLNKTTVLCELGGVSIGSSNAEGKSHDGNISIILPRSLTSFIGVWYLGLYDGDSTVQALIQPITSNLKKLDLQFAVLSANGHCQVLRHCSNLEDLQVLNRIGDEGLEVVASSCKNLHRLHVELGELHQGLITHRGLEVVALNCQQLEYVVIYVSTITNAALTTVGKNCPKLKAFRLALIDEAGTTEDPLDDGVRELIQGCPNLQRLGLLLQHGFLTDRGMGDIARYGQNLRVLLCRYLGETDWGLNLFAEGCHNLKRLEILERNFTDAGIIKLLLQMDSLKHVWLKSFKSADLGQQLLALKERGWNVELIHDLEEQPPQFLAYRSLAGRRTDYPETVG